MPQPADWDLGENNRFAIQRRLGQGGFGVVYRAYDKKREQVVALKTLRRMDPEGLYRFKREFRILADILHPNLVVLYELLSERDDWFFTMELVDGVSILEYVRGGVRAANPDSSPDWLTPRPADFPLQNVEPPTLDTLNGAHTQEISPRKSEGVGVPPSPVRIDRLRESFRQLAGALCALHEAGVVHRDIKPSNVLVARDGRVVLLDFGLALELSSEDLAQTVQMAGTPAYIAPEQAAGGLTSAAGDWYCVGVMLYEALTGRMPFAGSMIDVLNAKRTQDPAPPQEIVSGLPEDLCKLCQDLLQRDPKARPMGQQTLTLLGGPHAGTRQKSARDAPGQRDRPFVGRKSHLHSLDEAFEAARQGRAGVVHIRGRSGMGKSTLVRRFLEKLRQREPDVVLVAGRCYEREIVPYKGVDSLIDDLSRFLQRLPATEAEKFMPRDVSALSRLFPVLRQVDSVTAARGRMPDVVDPQELRRRGFAALRELLARLADRMSVVLFVDDLQWSDLDSVALLAELMQPPDPPPLLLILCYRSEEAEGNPVIQKLCAAGADPASAASVTDLQVVELDEEEARALAVELIERIPMSAGIHANAIAKESGGHPLFLDELVRHAGLDEGTGVKTGPAEATLEEMIHARVNTLPEPARRLLEAGAVAGKPIRLEVVARAAGVSKDSNEILRHLTGAHLMRTRTARETQMVESYHDRIRETVTSHLTLEELKTTHHSLALALQELGEDEPEALAIHFREGGEPAQAARYAVLAAARAEEALAFDQAAQLYKFALDLHQAQGEEARTLQTKLGGALANAGRGAEAANAYLAAARGAPPDQVLDLERRAAEQLLISGHVDDGLAVLRRVLSMVGMRLSKTPRGALISLLFRRAWIRLRGLGFRERSVSEISAEDLRKVDTCWSVAIGLGMSEPIQGAEFQGRHLLLALRAGELTRVARALAVETGYSAQPGGFSHARTQGLIARTLELSKRANAPYTTGLAILNKGIAGMLGGRFSEGKECAGQAETILREQCTGVTWELDTAQLFGFFCMLWRGDYGEMLQRYNVCRKQAEDRGDLYLLSWLRPRISYVLALAADDPQRAEEEERIGIAGWPRREFDLLRYEDVFVQTDIHLYKNQPQAAWDFLSGQWPALSRSLVLRIQIIFIEAQILRARSLLALAAGEQPSQKISVSHMLSMVDGCARKLERQKAPWAGILATHFRACTAATQGNDRAALKLIAAAEKGFGEVHMAPWAMAARRRRGQLVGGDEGAALILSADATLRGLPVKNPARVMEWLAPGKWQGR
ncbi:MAG: protein kinase [Candidatus Acidiferrales bacterium]